MISGRSIEFLHVNMLRKWHVLVEVTENEDDDIPSWSEVENMEHPH